MEHIFPFRDVLGMQYFTTELLTLAEFVTRRKIGRTTIIERCTSGEYVEDIDFVCDGNEKKFFWPPKEFFIRDRCLQEICVSDSYKVEKSCQTSQSEATTRISLMNTSPSVEAALKPSRKMMPPVDISLPENGKTKSSRPLARKPAFVIHG